MPPSDSTSNTDRLIALVREQFAFVWRVLRRLGLSPADAEDAAQQVMMIVARRLTAIEPGSERAFVSRTATYVAMKAHRSQQRRRDQPGAEYEELAGDRPGPEELLTQRRARERLDDLLGAMPMELRAVLILFEIEGLSQPEIAMALQIPYGTVASRLRRARAELLRLAASRKGKAPRVKEVGQ